MTDKNRLIQLIKETDKIRKEHDNIKDCYEIVCDETDCYTCKCEKVADYLLANGIIVLPCKVGDKVYALYNGKVLKANIFSMKIETEDDKYDYMLKLKIFDHFFQFKTFLLGKTVFITREEAEKALERSKG